jgi:hypothetical protein
LSLLRAADFHVRRVAPLRRHRLQQAAPHSNRPSNAVTLFVRTLHNPLIGYFIA